MSAPETPDAPAAPAAPGKAKKTILLAVVVVLGIGLGGAGGVMLAGPLLAGGAAPAAAADSAHAAEDEEDEAAADTTAPAVVYMVENLVLNPAGTNGSRFLLLTLGLAVPDEAASQTLQTRDPELRDVVIRILGAKGVDQLADITRRDSLKAELKTALVERFGKKSVLDVYFPQFVIQ
jgi:flagellar FliL protein